MSYNQRFAQMWRHPAGGAGIGRRREGHRPSPSTSSRRPSSSCRKIQQVYAQPDVESFDVLEFKDGRVFERYSIPQMLDGQPVGRVWSFRDVTGRRRAEAAQRQSEASFRLLFANHPVPMWVFDMHDLRFLEVNEAAMDDYGYSRDEFLAMGSPTSARGPRPARAVRREARHRRKDGTLIDVDMVSHVLEFVGRRASWSRPRTSPSSKRAEEALRESEERYRTPGRAVSRRASPSTARARSCSRTRPA